MISRWLELVSGSLLLGLGVVLTVKTLWGPAAWDVLHLAVAGHTGLTLGQVSIMTSLTLFLITFALGGGWTIRWGTIVNTVIVGTSIDTYIRLGIRDAANPATALVYLVLGTFFLAAGSVFYTRAGLGAGARDGLILVLSQKLPYTVGRIRRGLETMICLTGWLLGGPVGPATVVIVLAVGPISDVIFSIIGRGQLPTTVRIPERS